MSKYKVEVAGMRLPEGGKYVKFGIVMQDGDVMVSFLFEPKHAKMIGDELLKAAAEVERLIEIPRGTAIADMES